MMMILFFMLSIISLMKMFNMKFFNLLLFLIFMLLFKYDGFNGDWLQISFNFGMNYYSFMLVLLSLFIFSMVFMMSNLSKFSMTLNFMLMVNLILVFLSMNFLMFYFLFEVSLIFIFIIIIKWGSGAYRLMSSYYFLFYTIFFSFPLLVFMFMNICECNMSMMNLMELMKIEIDYYMYSYMASSFFVKIPMYSLHSWLLKAHVDAPLFGSMILAAILLKLGTYGLMRLMLIYYKNTYFMSVYILLFSIFGGVITSIYCLRQIDMKVLVAYSSIVHMSILLSSVLTYLLMGFKGSYMMMIAHGLCSSGMFYLVNLCYLSTNSRLMIINKGFMSIMPSMSLLWFMLCSSNMASPVSMNLISEIMLFISLFLWEFKLMFVLMFFSFFSFSYSLYLFMNQHGKMNFYLSFFVGGIVDYFLLLCHWVLLNFMFLNLVFFI